MTMTTRSTTVPASNPATRAEPEDEHRAVHAGLSSPATPAPAPGAPEAAPGQTWRDALAAAAAHWADALREQYHLIDTDRADVAARLALGADYTPATAATWLTRVTAFRTAH